MKRILVLLFLFVAPTIHGQEGFEINGTIQTTNKRIASVFLTYENSNGKRISDTVAVTNGRFIIRGKLAQPSRVLFGFIPEPSPGQERTKRAATFPMVVDNAMMVVDYAGGSRISLNGSPTRNDELAFLSVLGNRNARVDRFPVVDSFVRANPLSGYNLVLLNDQLSYASREPKFTELFMILPPSSRQSVLGEKIASQLDKLSKIQKGNAAPNFTLPDAGGKIHTLASLRGKYVFLEFWSSYCVPCRKESKYVVQALRDLDGQPVTFVSISLDNELGRKAWMDAIKKDGLLWLQLLDTSGFEGKTARDYTVQGIPDNFLIDPSGNVIARNLRGEGLAEKIKLYIE